MRPGAYKALFSEIPEPLLADAVIGDPEPMQKEKVVGENDGEMAEDGAPEPPREEGISPSPVAAQDPAMIAGAPGSGPWALAIRGRFGTWVLRIQNSKSPDPLPWNL